MKLKELEMWSFLSMGHALFKPRDGLILIDGSCPDSKSSNSNGAGKTTIFAALLWGIYNKIMRGTKADDVINLYMEKGTTRVRELWELDNGSELEFSRYRGHVTKGNSLEVFVDGEDISGPSAQQDLENLIGISYDVFLNSIMFGQDIAMFGRLTDAGRKELLDNILDLTVLNKALKITKEKHKHIIGEKIKLDNKVIEYDAEINTAITTLEGLDEANLEFKIIKKNDIIHLKAMIKINESHLNESSNAYDKVEDKYDKLMNSSNRHTNKQLELTEVKDKAVNKRIKYKEKETEIIQEETKAEMLLNEYEKFRKVKGGSICPHCKGKVDASHILKIKDKLFKSYEIKGAYSEALRSSYDKKLVLHDKQVTKKLEVVTKVKAKITELKFDMKDLRQSLTSIKSKITEYKANLKIFRPNLIELKAKKNPYEEIITDTELAMTTKEFELDNIKIEIGNYTCDLNILDFWIEGFGSKGIKSFILDTITPALNLIADKVSQALTDGEYKIEFYTKKQKKSSDDYIEQFGFNVEIENGGANYKDCSAGEKRRIDLIIMFSLQHLVESITGFVSNIVFFDEVFDHMDATGREKVLDVLQNETEYRDTICVITQEASFSEYFTNVLTVEKREGISSISWN